MATEINDARLQELSESNYDMLKESYCSVQQLKGLVDRLHANYMKQGVTLELDTVVAIKLVTDRLYGEMERYLRPEVDPDSAYDDAMIEKPR